MLDLTSLLLALAEKAKAPLHECTLAAQTKGMTPGYSGKGNSYGLAGQFEEAFNQFGYSMMTDDFAAKLLAYVLQMGGGNEAVVTHYGLNAGIQIAQQKFNLYGGEVPNHDLLKLFQQYNKELELTHLHN